MTVWNIANTGNVSYVDGGAISGVDNNGGVITRVGTPGDATLWAQATLANSKTTTIVSGMPAITGILSAGAFNGGTQVIKRVTNTIAGTSNTVLLFGASDGAAGNSIHQAQVVRSNQYKTAIRENKWNEFSGVFDTGFPEIVNSGAYSQATDTDVSQELATSGVDNASNPTAAIPGELVYRDGSPLPNQDDYKARTLY